MRLVQRQEDGRQTLDVSERNTTGDLYVLKWDRKAGGLLALAGPYSAEQIDALDADSLPWQTGPDIAWAASEEWHERAVVADDQQA